MSDECQCSVDGMCSVFNREMHGRMREICQGCGISQELRAKYLEKWGREALGAGVEHPRLEKYKGVRGAGSHLKALIEWVGVKPDKKCGCEALAQMMDRNGVGWCERNIGVILPKMRENAAKLGYPFIEVLAKRMVLLAIDRAKKEALEATITPSTSPHVIAELFLRRSPIPPWPEGNKWQRWENVQEGFRIAFNEARFNIPKSPHFPIRKGIVICAGGWRFFPSLYVTVRIIRETGCTLPIQVWYLGEVEYDPRMSELLAPYNVEMIDGVKFVNTHCPGMFRCLGGWEMKAIAAAYSPFREVFSLDADCYPTYNLSKFMERVEYKNVGAVFWPDHYPLKKEQFELFGVPVPEKEVGLESGQFLVDKQVHWKALWLSAWLNGNSDYIYPTRTMIDFLYGDKDTFAMGWGKVGAKFILPRPKPGYRKVAFLQKDFDGKTFLIHRTMGKFKFRHPVDGVGVSKSYSTTQLEDVDTSEFPYDAFARKCLAEIEAVLCTTPALESYLLEHVHTNKDAIALDVGANIGDWGKVLGSRFKHVFMYEPVPSTAALIPRLSNATIIPCAVSNFDGGVEMVEREKNTLSSLSSIPTEIRNESEVRRFEVQCITLDSQTYPERVGFVKIDVEGEECNVLLGARNMLKSHSPQVLIEFHSKQNQQFVSGFLKELGYNEVLVRHPYYEVGSELYESHGWIVGTKEGT